DIETPEVFARSPEDRGVRLDEDPREVSLGEVIEHHDRLETRDELRRHPVAEQIVVFQIVGEMERQLLAHLARGRDHDDRLHRRDVLPDRGAAQHAVVQLLERSAGDEEDVRGVENEVPAVGLELHVLVLHQRQQRFLRDDAAHVRRAADARADLVDFVDEHDAALDAADDFVRRRGRTEHLLRVRVQPPQYGFPVTLPLLGEHVGVEADDVRVLPQRRVSREELLDRAHERRLSRAGVADEQDVRRRMPDEMLHQRDGDLADRIVLADDGFAKFLKDVFGTDREGVHWRRDCSDPGQKEKVKRKKCSRLSAKPLLPFTFYLSTMCYVTNEKMTANNSSTTTAAEIHSACTVGRCMLTVSRRSPRRYCRYSTRGRRTPTFSSRLG